MRTFLLILLGLSSQNKALNWEKMGERVLEKISKLFILFTYNHKPFTFTGRGLKKSFLNGCFLGTIELINNVFYF